MNRGKKFESLIKSALDKIDGVYTLRLYDVCGSTSYPCDYISYKFPYLYLLECKSHQGNTLPFAAISNNQWKYMSEAIKISKHIKAYVIVWFVDKDVTKVFSMKYLLLLKDKGKKSVRFDDDTGKDVPATKKRTYFDYNLENLFK